MNQRNDEEKIVIRKEDITEEDEFATTPVDITENEESPIISISQGDLAPPSKGHEPAITGRPRRRGIPRNLIYALSAVVIVVGIGLGAYFGISALGDGNGTQTATAIIGSNGGTASLKTNDGTATVHFSEGAVASDVSVEISAKEPVTSLPEELHYASEYAYDITCSATTFNDNIAITLPITQFDPELTYAIVRQNDGVWEDVGGFVDQASNTITASVDHLSLYTVISLLRYLGSYDCESDGQIDCETEAPTFEFESNNAKVFSVPCPVGEVKWREVLTTDSCMTALSYALGGSVVPGMGTIIAAVAGLANLAEEVGDPVRIAPLTAELEIVEGLVEAGQLPSEDQVSAIIFLDFMGTRIDSEYIDNYRKGLNIYLGGRYLYGAYETRLLLTEDEMRSLDPCKSYIVIPKKPFNVPEQAERRSEIFLTVIAKWKGLWGVDWFYGDDKAKARFDLDDVAAIAIPTQTVVISIPSTRPWTDTGILVSPGDVISITASGSVSWDSSGVQVGPDGRYDTGQGSCGFVVMDSNVPAQSLIGNIAPSSTLDGKGFFVGSSFDGIVPIPNTTSQTGRLFLGFNDGAVYCDRSGYDSWGFGGDNHGSFDISITITDG